MSDTVKVELWFLRVEPDLAERVVHAIGLISIVVAAAFGLIALFTSYKDEKGRTTMWGRLAAAGVVMSALISLANQSIGAAVDVAKKEQDRQAADQRHAEQIGRYGDVIRTQAGLLDVGAVTRDRLGEALRRQDVQLDASRRISDDLGQTARQGQSQANTLLRSLWASADRLRGDDVRFHVSSVCLLGEEHPLFDKLVTQTSTEDIFEPGMTGFFAARAPTKEGAGSICNGSLNCPADQTRAIQSGGSAPRRIVGEPRVVINKRVAYRHVVEIREESEYSGFQLSDMYAPSLSAMNGGTIEFVLDGAISPLVEQLFQIEMGARRPDDRPPKPGTLNVGLGDGIEPRFWRGPEGARTEIYRHQALLPCTATVNLSIGDQWIETQTGRYVAGGTTPLGEATHRDIHLVMSRFTIPPDRFPRFAALGR